jgi:ATP-binding cassette subfamily F protein uup
MNALIACHHISKSYGPHRLFEDISFTVHSEQRLAIIGPNGAGKSSLLRVLARRDSPDQGEVTWRRELRVALVPQEPHFPPELEVVAAVGQAAQGAPLGPLDNETVREVRVATSLDSFGFSDPHQRLGALSGGWTKRVALACALVTEPDLLLLDEPTNHLDLEGIHDLEKRLQASRSAVVVVTHDRAFLEAVSRQVMEVDRQYPKGYFLVEGSYSQFREKREEFQATQQRQELTLRTQVKRELEWLRRGPKARTSKARGRIERAGELFDELAELKGRMRQQDTSVEIAATGRKTKRLLWALELGHELGGRTLFSGLNLLLRPGLRLGLVGANGSGKTTLLRLLAGELEATNGLVGQAEGLHVVYFDQQREQLDRELTLRRNLAPDGDTVIFRGRSIHVTSWARRFRFHTDQLDLPAGELSGGEQAKAMIARLLLQPADVLLLDEPTNDLDLSTLEVLEESLLDFPGALVMVTHDRFMLDSVCSLVLGLSGPEGAQFYGDYSQWTEARQESRRPRKVAKARPTPPPPTDGPRPATYLEEQEYRGMEEAILVAEEELEEAQQAAADPAVASNADELASRYKLLRGAETKVEQLYARWAELDTKVKAKKKGRG